VSGLAIPLTVAQVEAAASLHQRLESWAISDRALKLLRQRCPGFGAEATLLKVVGINQLYGTNVYAVGRMAAHITQTLAQHPPLPGADLDADIALVERIAALPKAANQQRAYTHTSFASKFAHFFIAGDRFPIYDEYAARMVAYHLGKARHTEPTRPYRAFVRNIDLLRNRAGLTCGLVALDRYLWLAGLYRAWQRNPAGPLNVEVARLFSTATPQTAVVLATLLPDIAEQAFTVGL
jgi:hypothetical protein